MDVLRTPDERFVGLPDYAFAPRYADIEPGLRMHYVDEGPTDALPVLLLHGEPSWSYLYRHMIPPLVAAGYRVIAPDLIGFGRSDKPAAREAHSYAGHVAWVHAFLEAIDLTRITLFCQDWGGLIGLRVVAEAGERFDRVCAANTGLPTGNETVPDAFFAWRRFSQETPVFATGRIVSGGCVRDLSEAEVAAYDAPYPDTTYQAGPRQMPTLVPASPDDPAGPANRAAWERLESWNKPFLCAFSDSDPVTRGADRLFRARIPGCEGQAHTTVANAGHFLQEDAPAELAHILVDFIETNPLD